jgi:toxin FitB
MYLLDTNLIIYSAQAEFRNLLFPLVTDEDNAVSIITTIETLGFKGLTMEENLYFRNIFKLTEILQLNTQIAEKAILLRQTHKIHLGDAIIAATALHHNMELLTRNLSDFKNIEHLRVSNPL